MFRTFFYCSKHHSRVRLHGNPYKKYASRQWLLAWKVYQRQYNIINVDGIWRPEHVVIAEQEIGRKLKRGEVVHHQNGNKRDNKDNLRVMTRKYHKKHFRELHPWLSKKG